MCECEGEGFVFFEASYDVPSVGVVVVGGEGGTAAEEPFGEGHVCFDFAVLGGEAVVLDGEEGVEVEGGVGEFVGVSELVLGGTVVEVGCALEVVAGFEVGGGAVGYEGRGVWVRGSGSGVGGYGGEGGECLWGYWWDR